MAILISNDDGLTDGLRLLSEAASKLDPSAYAVTPDKQRSAVAKGVTLHKSMRLRRAETEKSQIYTLSGTPADCVSFALCSGEFKKPSLMLSGVNIGDNLSLHSFYSSGTIGACLEAAFYGVPSIAFSLEMHKEDRYKANYSVWEGRDALKERIVEIVKKVKGRIPEYTVLNVNFPAEFEAAEFAFPMPEMMKYATKIDKRLDPMNVPYYWQYGENREFKQGSDVYELYVNKAITITAISVRSMVDEKLNKEISKLF